MSSETQRGRLHKNNFCSGSRAPKGSHKPKELFILSPTPLLQLPLQQIGHITYLSAQSGKTKGNNEFGLGQVKFEVSTEFSK